MDGIGKRLGTLIRRERQACGLSVREIARRSGVSFRTLYAYEHSETAGGATLDKYLAICEVIGADPAQLLAEAMASVEKQTDGREPEGTV